MGKRGAADASELNNREEQIILVFERLFFCEE